MDVFLGKPTLEKLGITRTYPQEAINLKAAGRDSDILLTYSGYYERFRYYPEVSVYYYDNKGNPQEPDYIVLKGSQTYDGYNKTLEEAKKDTTPRAWFGSRLIYAGRYGLEVCKYKSKEDYEKIGVKRGVSYISM